MTTNYLLRNHYVVVAPLVCVQVHCFQTKLHKADSKVRQGQTERDSVSKRELDRQERENMCVREIENKFEEHRVEGQRAVLPVWARSSAVCLIYSERQLGFG